MAAPSAPSPVAQRPLGHLLLWPAAAVLLGMLLMYNSLFGAPSAIPESRPAPAAAAGARTPSASPTTDLELPHSAPKRLVIPSIAVDAPFTPLTLGAGGHLNAPPADNKNLVGWYEGGVTPGERGSAIVAGHVDTKTGPAVFLLLDSLKPGNSVDITRADGMVATFKVDSVKTFSKANFPDEQVYGQTSTPQLRLITCGGTYDRKAKDYTDNVVVFAHLDSARRA